MKYKYKLKSGTAAAVHALKTGDFSGVDAVEKHNKNILRDVYKRIQFGLVDVAYMSTGGANGGNLYVVSRDSVYAPAVRVSVFWRRGSGENVEFLASSHHVYSTLAEFLRDPCLPSGWLHVGDDWRYKMGVA